MAGSLVARASRRTPRHGRVRRTRRGVGVLFGLGRTWRCAPSGRVPRR